MTVTEIARQAGVSIGTVDRVLHNRGRVSSATKAKIQSIIDKCGYQPNPIARHLKKQSPYRIGVLLPELGTGYGYWEKLYEGISIAAKEDFSAFSFSIEPFFFERPVESSLANRFTSMIAADCDAYIIAPVMRKEIKRLLDDVPISKPYCFVDCPLPNTAPIFTIAQNPYKAGVCAGKLTELVTGKKQGTYAVLQVYDASFNQDERARGFCDWFYNNAHANKTRHVLVKNASPAGIMQEVQNLFTTTADLLGICTVSVEVQFVAEALSQAGRKSDIAVVGFDLVEANCAALVDGRIDCLISQQPQEQGRTAVRQLFRTLVYGETVESSIEIPLEIFFKENLI